MKQLYSFALKKVSNLSLPWNLLVLALIQHTFSEVAHLASKTLLSVLFFDNVYSDTIGFSLLSKITKLLLFE